MYGLHFARSYQITGSWSGCTARWASGSMEWYIIAIQYQRADISGPKARLQPGRRAAASSTWARRLCVLMMIRSDCQAPSGLVASPSRAVGRWDVPADAARMRMREFLAILSLAYMGPVFPE